jgi:hypothetical protein
MAAQALHQQAPSLRMAQQVLGLGADQPVGTAAVVRTFCWFTV